MDFSLKLVNGLKHEDWALNTLRNSQTRNHSEFSDKQQINLQILMQILSSLPWRTYLRFLKEFKVTDVVILGKRWKKYLICVSHAILMHLLNCGICEI